MGKTTLADLMAAQKLGTLAANTEVIPASEINEALAEQYQAGITAARGMPVRESRISSLSGTAHECGIAGCRHGSHAAGASQPDRQVKLACPQCGAVARMTQRALNVGGGLQCVGDGSTFTVAARRQYRKAGAE